MALQVERCLSLLGMVPDCNAEHGAIRGSEGFRRDHLRRQNDALQASSMTSYTRFQRDLLRLERFVESWESLCRSLMSVRKFSSSPRGKHAWPHLEVACSDSEQVRQLNGSQSNIFW